MNLVRHQVAELHHVNVPDDDLLIKRLARPAIDKIRLGVFWQLRFLEVSTNVLFLDAIEYRRSELQAEQSCRPTKVRLQYLPDVHARGDAQRVQHDVHRCSVRQEGHVFLRHNLGNNTFVTVTASHLITNRQLALRGDIDFDRLDDAAIDALAGLGALKLFVVLHLQVVELLFEATNDFVDLVTDRRGVDLDAVINLRQLAQERLGDLPIGRDNDFPSLAVNHVERNLLAQQDVAEGFSKLLAQLVSLPPVFFFHLFGMTLLFGDSGPNIVIGLFLGRNLHVHHNAVGAGRNLQRGVFHIGGFLAEDGPQQPLFRSELCFALGRDLADQDVARLHLGTNADDAVGSKVPERLITQVRNVARDFFRPKLGIAGPDLELIDVDRGKDIVLNDALADEDGVFKVVTVPRHEGDQHVAA